MAKVEQAFTVSPRTSSDRHQLEKVASATPREGQLSAGQNSSNIHQMSIIVGPCICHEAGPGLAAAASLRGGLVSFSAWLGSGSLAAEHHGGALHPACSFGRPLSPEKVASATSQEAQLAGPCDQLSLDSPESCAPQGSTCRAAGTAALQSRHLAHFTCTLHAGCLNVACLAC